MTIVCDRCGGHFDAIFDTSVEFEVIETQERPDYHLCLACSKELRVWVESAPKISELEWLAGQDKQ